MHHSSPCSRLLILRDYFYILFRGGERCFDTPQTPRYVVTVLQVRDCVDVGWNSVAAVARTARHRPGTGSGVHLHTTAAHVSAGTSTSGRKACAVPVVVGR